MSRWKTYEDLHNYLDTNDGFICGDTYLLSKKEIEQGFYYDKNIEIGEKCTIPDWMIDEMSNFGQVCYYDKYNKGILIGISYTTEDFYYTILTEDNQLKYETCVGRLIYE